MREYGNLYCDLSAGSGANAMMRDPEFAAGFIEEFSDRILYGCDICSVSNRSVYEFDAFLTGLCESGMISEENYRKIVRENAVKLLGL
jgi:predicted TIM-barrel fold metal-dependent hydrolase